MFMLLKLSIAHSQDVLQDHIKRFIESDCEVFIIIINSQQIHKKMINHLRIMIEAEERQSRIWRKLFVLLFQICPQEFYTTVYPSLFLQGWDHHYLDSIASVKLTPSGLKKHVVDIELWFQLTCLQTSENTLLNDRLNQLLKEAIPVVASKLDIPTSKHFSATVDASSKTVFVERLFSGDKETVGEILLKKFCLLWNPTLMADYIDSAANTGYSTKSTLNIIETVETTFRFLFFDFLIYMLSCIGAGLNLDWVFDSKLKCSAECLFYEIIECFPCPALYLLPTYCSTLRTHLMYSKKNRLFPFFSEISEAMNKVVAMCREFGLDENIQKECAMTTSIQFPVNSRVVAMKQLATEITRLLNTIVKTRLQRKDRGLKKESHGLLDDTEPGDERGIQISDGDSYSLVTSLLVSVLFFLLVYFLGNGIMGCHISNW